MVVGHVAPEAAVGGNIALIEEGDLITIDADERLLKFIFPTKNYPKDAQIGKCPNR